MAKRHTYSHLSFEDSTEKGKFTKICDGMMKSSAWMALSLRQKGLYLELKAKYTQKKSNGVVISDNADNISIPKSEAIKLYGNLVTFRKDIDTLIECGFIKLIQSGFNTRTSNIYGFSDRWKEFGTPDFKIPTCEKRTCRAKAKKPNDF